MVEISEMKYGWEFFNELEKKANSKEDKEKIRDLQRSYEACFAAREGQVVLADLEKRFVDPYVLTGYYPDSGNTAIAMAVRATEQRLIRMLRTMSNPGEQNAGKSEPRKPSPGKRKPK